MLQVPGTMKHVEPALLVVDEALVELAAVVALVVALEEAAVALVVALEEGPEDEAVSAPLDVGLAPPALAVVGAPPWPPTLAVLRAPPSPPPGAPPKPAPRPPSSLPCAQLAADSAPTTSTMSAGVRMVSGLSQGSGSRGRNPLHRRGPRARSCRMSPT